MIKHFIPLVFFIFFLIFSITAQDLYWGEPVPIASGNTRFPATAGNNEISVVVWQEIEQTENQQGTIWLSAKIYTSSSDLTHSRFAGPFPYSGEVPNLFSVAVNDKGIISIPVLSAANIISVFSSVNKGASFTEEKLLQNMSSLVAPRIFQSSTDGFIIFATQGKAQAFSLKASRSKNGVEWSNFEEFAPSTIFANSFIPTLAVLSDDRELVVFQSTYTTANSVSYQLYSAYSDNGGEEWSEAVLVTDIEINENSFSKYTNQGPYVHVLNEQIFLAWERIRSTSSRTSIYIAEISTDGHIIGQMNELIFDDVDTFQPVLFTYNDDLAVLWIDKRGGVNNIFFAKKNGLLWDEQRISTNGVTLSFASPMITTDSKNFHIVWEEQDDIRNYEVMLLSLDSFVPPPYLSAVSFTEGRRSTGDKIDVRIRFPDDLSGISGYSWIITQNFDENPPKQIRSFLNEDIISGFVQKDGPWYIKARVMDNAGNWSTNDTITFYRDTTPPEKLTINQPAIGNDGISLSNTFNITWKTPNDGDIIEGYTYAFDYITPIQNYIKAPQNYTIERIADRHSSLPSRILTRNRIFSLKNHANGIYLFSVSAIDSVGNISEVASMPIYLDNHLYSTRITSVHPQTDEFGNVDLSILGTGFLSDGVTSALYLDKDGIAPYDRVFELSSDGYTINSDKQISNIEFAGLEEGLYRIGFLHSKRGLYMSSPILFVKEFGVVKTGDYTYNFTPNWNEITEIYNYTIQISDIILWTVFALSLVVMIFAIRGIFMTVKDAVAVRNEVQSLIIGDTMALEKKKSFSHFRKQGMGLKYKMMFFTSVLVLMVILLVSLPLGFIFIRTQARTLASGLEDQVDVLLESFSSGIKNFMPAQNVLELSLLLNQVESMPQIKYATILGLPADGTNTNMDYVWVSNDPDILNKIDSENLVLGSSRFIDDGIGDITENLIKIDLEAVDSVGGLTESIATLTAEGLALALNTDATSNARREEIQTIVNGLNKTLTSELRELSTTASGSFPQFNNVQLSTDFTEYLFYKPVLYRQGAEQTYVRGIVLLQVSTDELLETLLSAQWQIVSIASLIAFIAISIGVIGALALASIIIKPIRRLADHVGMIRDTEDKEELDGKDIKIDSHDELGALGEIVNEMTHELVKAAIATKDLTIGKEVQRMFIPLLTDENGKKLTTGKEEDDNAQFFGYYEGAKGVSGDYFDYLKLDDRHFGIIKCDVSGKGVSAALIMVEVATLFLNYFKDWTYKQNGYRLSSIVGQINDLLESRGFQGRFAAFTLCVFDSVSGDVYFCNAGDNIIHIYDASERKKKEVVLPETPASGVFPTSMIEQRGGFKVQKLHLDKDDVLFLYTDGIEESKRLFRDDKYNPIIYNESKDIAYNPQAFGQDGENLTADRVNNIIEAVFARTSYKLEKLHSPIVGEKLLFDFSLCEGTVEDAIMALVSVEKVFRMYLHPNATEFDRVQVDRKIDKFLQKHFLQYNKYCSNKRDHTEFNEYMYYTEVMEDEQYDDLALVAIRKK